MPIAATFRHCPNCGTATNIQDNGREFRCDACAYHYFHNVACAAAGVLIHANNVLVTTRAQPPFSGCLDLPGGFIEPGESAESGLVRELAEELGVVIAPTRAHYLLSAANEYVYDDVTYATCDLFFRVDFVEQPLIKPSCEIAALQWIALPALRPSQFAMRSVQAAIEHLLRT